MTKRFWDKKNTGMKVKICNMKYLDVAYESAILGADALGFHVWKTSDVEGKILEFRHIIKFLPKEVSYWMLTDIYEPYVLKKVLDKVDFDTIQFQGKVGSSKFQDLICELSSRRKKNELMIVKTISLDVDSKYEDILKIAQVFSKSVDALLFDSKRKGRWKGGTGIIHNWELSAELVKNIGKPVILAGGLTPKNVFQAIKKVRPYGVDVESGVETVVGTYKNREIKCKSIMKIKEFISECKQFDYGFDKIV